MASYTFTQQHHTDASGATTHDGGRFLRALAPAAAAAEAEAHPVADADAAHGPADADPGHGESHGSIFMQALSLDQRKVRKGVKELARHHGSIDRFAVCQLL